MELAGESVHPFCFSLLLGLLLNVRDIWMKESKYSMNAMRCRSFWDLGWFVVDH
jgi:hypothetical protein